MNKTIFTLFSGGELAGVGARNAGFDHLGGIEYDPQIAGVAILNGFDLTVADILGCRPEDFPRPDLLHASPVCTRASTANKKSGGESSLDIAMGEKIAEFIQVMLPDCFTLENVERYRKFKALEHILKALEENNYFYDIRVLNAADFGVPQSRRRLFLRAVRGGWVPNLPQPVKWKGWYEAIEDLRPGNWTGFQKNSGHLYSLRAGISIKFHSPNRMSRRIRSQPTETS
jgi:DNA (cytosine-5)-methyltransferase 1